MILKADIETPEKIYLNKNEIGQYLLWLDKESGEDIEYIRSDIAKTKLDMAIEIIEENIKDGSACNICGGWEVCNKLIACIKKVYSGRLSQLKDKEDK